MAEFDDRQTKKLETASLNEALRGGEAGAIRGMDAQTLISLLTEQT